MMEPNSDFTKSRQHNAVMDRELDDSLQEIKKLLFLNARINLLAVKEMPTDPEGIEELHGIHKILDTMISDWTFQHEMR